MKIGNRMFEDSNKTYIMGILNVTPDSFSDGGHFLHCEKALFHAGRMIEEGADIIDVGGESTRPGYTKIEEEQEIERTIPVIRAIKENFDVPVSIDTYKGKVAAEALKAGADLVNDIWGLKYDENMAAIIKNAGAAVCLMHNRERINYGDFLSDVRNDLAESVKIAKEAGIGEDRILVDPGIGFAKTSEMNLLCLKHLEEFQKLSYPVLIGTSRKSLIGGVLRLPVEERLEGTLATTAIAVMKGCRFVRVHDVKENKRVIDMVEAVMRV